MARAILLVLLHCFPVLLGFTFMASVGLGYAPGVPRRVDGWAGLLGLAAGYTWRRMSPRDLRPMR